MRLKGVPHQAKALGIGVMPPSEGTDLMHPVHRGPELGDLHRAPATQRLHAHQEMRRGVACIGVILPHRVARLGRQQRAGLLEQVPEWLGHAHRRHLRILGPTGDLQPGLPPRHELNGLLRGHAVTFSQMRRQCSDSATACTSHNG
jgi:hypothetical protein